MAVDFIGAIHEYQGLSADVRPVATAESPIPVGSRYQELDGLKVLWVKTSEGPWSPVGSVNAELLISNERLTLAIGEATSLLNDLAPSIREITSR